MRKLLVRSLIALACVGSFVGASAQAAEPPAPIKEFHQIKPGLYRGARPTLEGLRYLASKGVKTILNVDNESKMVQWEIAEAEKLGMKVISHPMSGFWKPKTAQVNASLAVMADSSLYPLFLHCEHGQDRTGLLTGLFRVFHQSWDPAVAFEEMLENGFHQALIFLDHYYAKRTGYATPSPNHDNPGYYNP